VGEFDMNKSMILPVLGIAAGETMMFLGHTYLGLAIHIINFQAITLAIIFGSSSTDIKNVLQSLLLVLMLRIINLAMPQFFTLTLLWYPLVYGVMFIPVYSTIRNQEITSKELGMDFRRLHIYIPAAILIGAAMAFIEYNILHPSPLIPNLKISNLALITMTMFAFVGAVEELIFRSILQTRFEKVAGMRQGLILSGLLFGIMHSVYGIGIEVLFASLFGIMLGYIFRKTGSYPFILAIHGTANVFLYGLLPFIL
jgi:membrane protease YdiL (CAAX protease family)